MTELLRRDQANASEGQAVAPPSATVAPNMSVGKIDKSQLVIAEPKRLRDKAHLKFVASQPCLSAGGSRPIPITCVLPSREQSVLR
jgi:hypothetical protein